MSVKIKTAFDEINAEEALKENTLLYLRNHKYRKKQFVVRKLIPVCLALFFVTVAGIISHNFYMLPDLYIDVDINPSVELVVNRFDNVIDVQAYNQEGEDLILLNDLKNMKSKDALEELIRTFEKNGYVQDDGLISITLQTNDLNKEIDLLNEIQQIIGLSVQNYGTALEVFPVSAEIKSHAHELNISPAKYLAILELMEADPDVSIEGCVGHSIRQLRQMVHECKNKNHNTIANDSVVDNENVSHKGNCHHGNCKNNH